MIAFFNKTKGSISLFLAIIMLPMMTMAGLVVDGARISTAKTNLSNASDLAMNAALSEYDKILYDVYGIFAVSEDMEALEKNVTRYFQNTLSNAGVLEDSDSYTREFINSIFSSFSSDELEFGNIVDTEPKSFELSGVPSSAIANPKVLERQIVEYMKYRGPFNVGKGLLTKLGCIGETSKQSKALENKVEYDKKLETVQDACESAYQDIVAYNDRVGGSGSKFASNDYLNAASKDLQDAKTHIEKMVKYLLAYKDSNLHVKSYAKSNLTITELAQFALMYDASQAFDLDSTAKTEINKYYNKSEAENKNADTLDYISQQLAGSVKVIPGTEFDLDGQKFDFQDTEFMKALSKLDGTYKTTLEAQINDIRLHKAVPGMDRVFTLVFLYEKYYEDLDDEEKEPYERERAGFNVVFQILLASSEFCKDYNAEWKGKANSEGKAASDLLYAWYKQADENSKAAEKAHKSLETIIDKVKKLDSARTNWGNSVDNLSESDIKTSMKGDFDNSAKDINEEAIKKLMGVFERNKQHFDAIKERLNAVKLNGVQVCFEANNNTDFTARYSSLSSPQGYSAEAVSGIMNSKYTDQTLNGITPNALEKVDGAPERENQQFYRYLQRTCTAVDSEQNKGEKENAKKLKNLLVDKGNESTAAATLPENIPENLDDALPQDVRDAIDALYTSEDMPDAESDNTYQKDNLDKNGKDSDAADKGKENMSRMSKMLESLATIAAAAGEQMRDNLYVEEYYTEMFSCYTDAVTKKDQPITAKTLSGKEMKDNPLFGAEAEYILWGNADVNANLNYTRASIFGIRFLLNAIYAFTNTDTRTPALTAATAIAGWTGFGVPIVQTVILLAWASAESIYDVNALCEGKNIALYKTNKTWMLGYSGLKDVVMDETKNVLGDVATKTVDDVFEKVEEYVVGVSETKTEELVESLETFSNNTINGIKESVQGAISVPVQQLALQIAGATEELNQADIEGKLKVTLSGLHNSGSGLVNECINIAIDNLLKTQIGSVGHELYEMYIIAKDPNKTIDAINKKLYGEDGNSGLIGNLVNNISDAIESKIDAYGESFKKEVENQIRGGGENAKEVIKDKITSFTAGISGEKGTSSKSVGDNASASGFSFSYKEYVKVFILIHAMTGEGSRDAMLKRAAGLIQQNTKAAGSSGIDVTKAYTVVQVSSSADVRTTFFSVPISTTDAGGNTSYYLDYSAIGSGKQTVKYKGVLGY